MRVEPATMDDVDAVAELWLDLAAEQLQYGSHLRVEGNRETVRIDLARHVVSETVLVAREEGVIGFVSFEMTDGVFEERVRRGRVQNLYVEPGWRDRGVGSELLGAAEDALEDAGAEAIAVEAMAPNERARRLYERRGYEPHRIEYERPAETDTHSNEDA
ncbi:MAG: N-acetyltransferase family protein [Halobacteriales archaeon]